METRTKRSTDVIALLGCVNVILKHKTFICCIVVIAVLATGIGSLVMTPTYEATTVIAPVSKTSESMGAGGMAAIAAQFGVSAPASSSMSDITNLLKSDVLKEKVIEKYGLAQFLGKDLHKDVSKERNTRVGIRYLQRALKVTTMRKDNAVRLSVTCINPKMAADILYFMLTELTEHMSSEARRVAEANKKYLESEVERATDPFIRAKIYSLIAQQIESAMMAGVKENFAFKVIDPPRVPDKKVSPRRCRMVLVSFVASLFIGILAAFVKEFWLNHGEEIRRSMGKTERNKKIGESTKRGGKEG